MKPRLRWQWTATGALAREYLRELVRIERDRGQMVTHYQRPWSHPNFYEWGAAMLTPLPDDPDQRLRMIRYNVGAHRDEDARVICYTVVKAR